MISVHSTRCVELRTASKAESMDDMVTSVRVAIRKRGSKKSLGESDRSEAGCECANSDDSSSGCDGESFSAPILNMNARFHSRKLFILTLLNDQESKYDINDEQDDRQPKRPVNAEMIEPAHISSEALGLK